MQTLWCKLTTRVQCESADGCRPGRTNFPNPTHRTTSGQEQSPESGCCNRNPVRRSTSLRLVAAASRTPLPEHGSAERDQRSLSRLLQRWTRRLLVKRRGSLKRFVGAGGRRRPANSIMQRRPKRPCRDPTKAWLRASKKLHASASRELGDQWCACYAELLRYRQNHGTFAVPPDTELGAWARGPSGRPSGPASA